MASDAMLVSAEVRGASATFSVFMIVVLDAVVDMGTLVTLVVVINSIKTAGVILSLYAGEAHGNMDAVLVSESLAASSSWDVSKIREDDPPVTVAISVFLTTARCSVDVILVLGELVSVNVTT